MFSRLWLKKFLLNSNFFYKNVKFSELIVNSYLKICHEDDYHFFEVFKDRKNVLILDVGANYGQSIISFSSVLPNAKIISFEPGIDCTFYLEKLKKFTNLNYEYHKVGIGSSESEKDLFIPKIRNTLITQEASFNKDQLNQTDVYERIGNNFKIAIQRSNIKTIDSYDFSPDIIKIDVQGLEEDVLKGALNTIKVYNPALMIESNVHNNVIFNLLEDFNYSVFTYNKKLKYLKSWNLDDAIPYEENLIYLTDKHLKEFNIK